MKSILVIVNAGKISQNQNGGASVYYSHLELLYKAGYKTDLLTVSWDDNTDFKPEDYTAILPFVKQVHHYKIKISRPNIGLKRLYNAVFNPEVFEYFFLNDTNKDFLKTFISDNKIDFIWSEWRWAGIWSRWTNLKVPVIYAHHDWEYKLALLRKKPTLLKRFHTFQKKRVEKSLVKGVTACISGSFTEAKEITQISSKKALYLPTTYDTVTTLLDAHKLPDIIHLGGMGTTANRLGLERFLDISWQKIKDEIPQVKLKVIGSLNHASPVLLDKLKDNNIDSLGFVQNLGTVMYSNDIHIIPWEYNTGTRTRIPVVLNYQQVLVATRASVACFPEMKHNVNCILSNDLNEMTKQILTLFKDQKKLTNLAQQGKETFKNHFTSDNQKEKLKQFLEAII